MSRERQIGFWLVALLLSAAALWLLRGMLLPFIAGMAVAYFLDPLADRLERAGLSRTAATAAITAGFVVLLVLALVLLMPVLQAQVGALLARVPGYVERLTALLLPLLEQVQARLGPVELERLREAAGTFAGTGLAWTGAVLREVLASGAAVFNLLSLLFITPVVAFYLLRDWDQIVARVDSWLPRRHAATIRAQVAEVDRTLAGFLRGQATVCLVLAAYYGAALTLVGLDAGLILGIFAGLISFIPYVGAIAGFSLGVVLAVAQSQEWMLPAMVAAVFLVGQTAESYVLTPKLVGERIGLHPVWIIFALLAAGSLFGFVGVLLAVPLAAVIGVLVRFALSRYLLSPLYDGNGGGR